MNTVLIKAFILVCVVCITIIRCFFFPWNAPPQKWDEQTNIQVIQESIYAVNPFVLMYNNRPFFEKPPVWYLLTSTITKILGNNSPLITARLISALSGMFLLLFVFVIATRWWGFFAGVIAWGVLISTNHLFITNPAEVFSTHTIQSADSDVFFVLLIVLTSILLLGKQFSKTHAVLTGGITGLALLTKGPLAIIPLICATILAFSLRRKIKIISYYIFAWGLALGMSSVWIFCMYTMFSSSFITNFLGYHIVERSITAIESHKEPFLFYIQLLSTKQIFLFFEVYCASAVLYLLVKKYRADSRLMHVFFVSSLLILIPTLVQTKLAWYILPFYPYAALTVAGVVSQTVRVQDIFRKMRIMGV